MEILYVIIFASLYGKSSAVSKAQNFRTMMSSSGSGLCTRSAPSQTRTLNKGLSCGVDCLISSACQMFQTKEDINMCELFNTIPTNLAAIQGCSAYSVEYMEILYVIIFASLYGKSSAVSKAQNFRTMMSSSGSGLCTRSAPSQTRTLNKGLSCGVDCLISSACQMFQTKEDINMCELFNTIPTNLAAIQGCSAYSVESGSVCTNDSSFPYVVDSMNCSFPFTYNGMIYTSCTTQITGIPNNCATSACLMMDRQPARCYPPADFEAQNGTVNVSIPGLPTIPAMSIFGWIVMMSRYGMSGNWTLPWSSYKNGFILSDTDFWLGLQRVHMLTSSTSYRLRFEMFIPYRGRNWCSAEYKSFSVGSELTGYIVKLYQFSGDIKDAIILLDSNNQHQMKFSTYDVDNDLSTGSCSLANGGGGWWFNSCTAACITCHNTFWYNTTWVPQQIRMMIKPMP